MKHLALKTPATLFLTAAFLLTQVGGCKKSEDDAVAAVVTVAAEKPEIGEIAERIVTDAVLSPLAQATITPRISAPVKAFYVQRGTRVKAGQLLATLENRDLAATAMDYRGQLTTAEASYELQSKAQAPEDLKKAQMDAGQTQAQLDLQRAIVAARQNLFSQGAIAGRDLDIAKAALAQAEAAHNAAQNHLDNLRRVGSKATVQQSQGQLSSAKGKYLAAEAQKSYSEIRSPISGVVTDRPLFAGETASSATPLLTVIDTSALLAKVHLAQVVAQRLSVGSEGQMTVPGIGGPVAIKVSLISPAVDPGSTTVEVWLRVENANGQYTAGTPVRIALRGRSAANAVKVPIGALLTANDGSRLVMVVGADGVAHKRPVTAGINDGTDAQIAKGLAGSEQVITDGAYGLADGTKVKIGKPGEKEAGDKD